MNHKGGWALVKSSWASWMQYRSFFFLLAFGWMIPPLIYLFVWSTAAGGEAIGGMSRGEFVTYYLVLILVNQLTYAQANWTVGDLIRVGSMSVLLLRPLSPLYNTLAAELAGKVVMMAFAVPAAAILAVFLRPELNLAWSNGLAFIPALLLAWALRFCWGYWLALLAFWATRADGLLALQDALVFLLGGLVAPAMLLPGPMQAAATGLPFRYMVGFPVEVLTGQLHGMDLWLGFGFQIGWLAAAVALFALVWRLGVKHYEAVGG
jgi:ABC-2 type transport system permease protein